jgi:23S rRNA (uracil1939-C5)-methyltransferase
MTDAKTRLTIDRIGSDGDGLARTADGRLVVVPFSLPGEVIADGIAVSQSPDRIEPACPHFTACGGCVAQHMSPSIYAAWKRDLVVQPMRQNKIDESLIAPLVQISPNSRRRASFSVVKVGAVNRLGFHRRRDTTVLPIDACPVITPRMAAALPKLGELVSRLPTVTADTRLLVADLQGGLDVQVEGAGAKLSADLSAWIASKAAAAGIARLTLGRDTLVEHATVSLPGPAGDLRPGPGSFFQAVAEAEAAIITAVLAGLPKKVKRIADLYSGIGTLTLPLARHAPVFAADSEKHALTALEAAARHSQNLKPISTRVRDLSGEPISVKELEPYDTVVLDPPRAGAKAQSEMLAKSKVQTVIMVSCSPQSLARDARILLDGGFKAIGVTPIDQFLWSAHVEAVAVFRR